MLFPPTPPLLPPPFKKNKKYIFALNIIDFKREVNIWLDNGYFLNTKTVRVNNFDGSWFAEMIKFEKR